MMISISEDEACVIISAYLRSKGVDMDADVRPADIFCCGEKSFIFNADAAFISVFGNKQKQPEQDGIGGDK